MDNFIYLGSTLSRDGSLDAEINNRIAKASAAYGKLEKRVWSDHGITVNTKLGVYNACVLSCLLYGSETSTTGVTSNAWGVAPELSLRYHEDLLILVYVGYRCSGKSWHV